MSRLTIDDIFDQWRTNMASADYTNTQPAGDAFERLCIAFLNHDPEQKLQFRNTRMYSEWAKGYGMDAGTTGIDLVAELNDGTGFAAVQCKFHAEGATIAKKEIDSFLADSGTKNFKRRVIIDTTGKSWSSNVEKTLRSQVIKVTRLGLHNLRNSPIDWSSYIEGEKVVVQGPPELRPHQISAVEKVAAGLELPGSRGKLIMACGTGKTLTALRVAERMAGQGNRVLYLVPSLALMSQSIRDWSRDAMIPLRAFAVCSDAQVGKKKKSNDDNIDMDALDLAWPATTDAASLARPASAHVLESMTVVFATYHSSSVIELAQKEYGLPDFDLVICDEAHRTAGAILPGEEPTNFTRIHKNDCIRADRRLYMTATPKVYAESARDKAGKLVSALCSMDDEVLYGPVLYEIGFAEAVERDLLADYRVIVLTIPEGLAVKILAHYGGTLENGLKIDDTALMVGCWRALAKVDQTIFPELERNPMRRAIAFCKTIKASELVAELLDELAGKYRSLDKVNNPESSLPIHNAPAKHVDGTFNASRREDVLNWLDNPCENECRVVTNARCLTEGVDLPSLDGILFMHPRKSQIEVVQAVGRVMRKAEGKEMGYIILPVVITPGARAENALDDNERWRKVWQMLNAIRSHHEGFDAELNRIEMGERPEHLSIITLADWQPTPPSTPPEPEIGKGSASGTDDGESRVSILGEREPSLFDDLPGAIMARIVEKCGDRKYWGEWAGDVANIARKHIERITAMVTVDESNADNEDIRVAAEIFDGFVAELKDDLNPGVTKDDAIEMLAQHMVTGPVFDALFGKEAFTSHNPVSRAMQTVLDVIKPSGIDSEAKSLEGFYDSVRRRVKGAATDEAKQKIIAELYDKFFQKAFKETSKKLGVVYTPVEVVDFILHSVADVLKAEFGTGLGDKGVHILDPFTGTGSFISRMIQSGLIGGGDLERKYTEEIHANEIVLLAYYIAAVNIETVFHGITGGDYRPFEQICLTDTFQISEDDDLVASILEDNSNRRTHQKDQDIQVIIGNPPWMVRKKDHGYPNLYQQIEKTYAARSTATNKNSLYDSYKLAIRWASDRIGEKGIIGFVTNGSWIDGNADSGIRACLAEEFSSVHVLNLRGNARTSGELRRTEGANIFDQGTRAPVAITILVRNPATKHHACHILYRDIGDYLTKEGKLNKIASWKSIAGIGDWEKIKPNRYNDWIDQRDEGYDELYCLGSKDAKRGDQDNVIFQLFSNGYQTGRDAYIYNFSRDACGQNARLMIENYQAALSELGGVASHKTVEEITRHHSSTIHWDQDLKNKFRRHMEVVYSPHYIQKVPYRPFTKQNCYADDAVCHRPAIRRRMFPTIDTGNRVICVPGHGSTKPFSALLVDTIPDSELISKGQCFPRYRFEEQESEEGTFFGEYSVNDGLSRIDNITDYTQEYFRSHYQDQAISKDDIFNYVYGVLHAEDWRECYSNNLSKELPRIPLAPDFRVFEEAGAKLGALHLGYETGPEYHLGLEFAGEGGVLSEHLRIGKTMMKFVDTEKSVLKINENIRLTGIPKATHRYVVNGRTPIEWFIDRYRITRHKKSGIVNDPNGWFDEPQELITAFRRIVHVSVETVKIVEALPGSLE